MTFYLSFDKPIYNEVTTLLPVFARRDTGFLQKLS
jgi:hypothetical protein